MDVQVLSSTIISLDYPHYKVSEIPFTIFDKVSLNIHEPIMFALASPTPTNAALKEALLKTLFYFPSLTGSIGENEEGVPCILLGGKDQGMLFVEANVPAKLEDYLPLEPSVEKTKLYPSPDRPLKLLQIQLNRFSCNGLIVGITADHRVADGQSMSTFFAAWRNAVRGLQPKPLPVYDRTLIEPRHPPRCDYQFWGLEFEHLPMQPLDFDPHTPVGIVENHKVVNLLIRYSEDFIQTKLKSQLPQKCSTFGVLVAHLWKKISRVRGLSPDERTQMWITVNGRWRLNPGVPAEYFGNMILYANATTTVKHLLEGSLADAAGLIRDVVRGMDDSYFRSFIDFGKMNEREVLKPMTDIVDGNLLSPNLEVDSWLGLRLEEMDFGSEGGLCDYLPGWIPLEGTVRLLPALHGKHRGGVHVIVTLLEEHARVFKLISHSLNDLQA